MKIFVYGTLRQGERNAYHLNEATCLYENAWVNGALYDTERGYPVLFLNQPETTSARVYGEIYEINDDMLDTIDTLEGYVPNRAENLYERITATANTDHSGEFGNIITYMGGSQLQHCRKVIPLGDWKVYEYLKKSEYLYFAYGSCMDDERFKQEGVDKYFTNVVGKGVLENYNMQFSRATTDGGKADIIECATTSTEGIIYRVPMEAIDYLYKREGVYTNGYRPAIVSVSSGDQQYEALTFIGLDKQPETPPTDLYATEIIRGAIGVLSDEYIEHVKGKITKLTHINS